MIEKLKYGNIEFKDSIFVYNRNNNIEDEQQTVEGIDINLAIRHRICEKFVSLFIDAANAADGSSSGTAKTLTLSLSKLGKQHFPGIQDENDAINMIAELHHLHVTVS
eukprot:543891_1